MEWQEASPVERGALPGSRPRADSSAASSRLIPSVSRWRDPGFMTRYKLLLIDGEAARAAVLQEQLQLLGYGVLRATDGIEGHALASRGEWDLILLDLEVPGRDGQLICKSLRVRHQTTPVLA